MHLVLERDVYAATSDRVAMSQPAYIFSSNKFPSVTRPSSSHQSTTTEWIKICNDATTVVIAVTGDNDNLQTVG